MDELLAVKKKWNKVNKLLLIIYSSLLAITFLVFLIEQGKEILYECISSSSSLVKFAIFYGIAYLCAYKDGGYRFIFFYFIIQIVSIFSALILMTAEVLEEALPLFSEGFSNMGVLLTCQYLLPGIIFAAMHYLSAKWSLKLFKMNRAKKKSEKLKVEPLAAN